MVVHLGPMAVTDKIHPKEMWCFLEDQIIAVIPAVPL